MTEYVCLRCTEAADAVGREGEIEHFCEECDDDTFWAPTNEEDFDAPE